jgi:hypothetical protein
MVETVVMFAERFGSLKKMYSENLIKEISRTIDRGDELVTFEITIRDALDIIYIFSAGVDYGINMTPSMGLSK